MFPVWKLHFGLEISRYNDIIDIIDIIDKNQYGVNDPEQLLSLLDHLFISSFSFFSTINKATTRRFYLVMKHSQFNTGASIWPTWANKTIRRED